MKTLFAWGMIALAGGIPLTIVAINSHVRVTTSECRYFQFEQKTICSDDQRWDDAQYVERVATDNTELNQIYAAYRKQQSK